MAYHGPPKDPMSKTGRVWALADEISEARGRKATRDEVVGAYVREGGNKSTGDTQYSRWSRDFDDRRADPGGRAADEPAVKNGRAVIRIGPDGRVVIPAEMRRVMHLDEDGTVTAMIDEDGVVMLISRESAIRRTQRRARDLGRGRGSAVDELIAERRGEASREDGGR